MFHESISDCSGLVAPEHGSLSSNFALHGRHVTVSCDLGYKLSGDRTIVCSSGLWSGNVGTCVVEEGNRYMYDQERIQKH